MLKNLSLSLLCSLLSLGAFATHGITGIALTYEYVGNDRVVFRLQMTYQCDTANLPFYNFDNRYLVNFKPLYVVDDIVLDSSCVATPCVTDSNSQFLVTRLVTLETQPTLLTFPSGVNYLDFNLSERSMSGPSNYNNSGHWIHYWIYASVRIYKDSYPSSSPQVYFTNGDYINPVGQPTMATPSYSADNDSLHAQLWAPPMLGTVTPVFGPGLSQSNPVHNFVSYDANRGEIVSSQLQDTIRYFIGQEVNSFNSMGLPVSRIRFTRSFKTSSLWGSNTTEISCNNVGIPSHPITANVERTYHRSYVPLLDTFKLKLQFVADNLNDSLKVKLVSKFPGKSQPTLTISPSLPGSLPGIVEAEFSWIPDSMSGSKANRAFIEVAEVGCDFDRMTVVIDLETDEIQIPTDTIKACINTWVNMPMMSEPGFWTPHDSLYCTAQRCSVRFRNRKTYTYISRGVPIYSVYLDTTTVPRPSLTATSQSLSVSNYSRFDESRWYYFYVNTRDTSRTLTNPYWGYYQNVGRIGQCFKRSIFTPWQIPSSNFAIINSQRLVDDFDTLSPGDQFEHELRKLGSQTAWPGSVILPGVRLNPGDSIQCRLYFGNTMIHSSYAFPLRKKGCRFIFPKSLNAPVDLSIHSNMAFKLVFVVTRGNIAIPYSDPISTGMVYGDYRLIAARGTPQHRGLLVPIVFNSYYTVGEDEHQPESISIYPNPVQTHFYVEGLAEGESYQLIDSQGREVASGALENSRVDCSFLPSGIYLFRAGESSMKVSILR